MDELDRMYRRLVQNVRTGFPDLLGRPFEVAELYTTLIPYRHNRRDLELDTNQDYEHALLRLLSGERGYLIGDPVMQTELRSELDSPNPDLTKFRAYSTTMVSIAPDGARGAEPPVVRRPGSGGTAAILANLAPPPPAPAPSPAPAPATQAMAERPTLGVPEQAARPAPRPAAPPPAAPLPPPSVPQPTLSATGQRSIVASGGCRYCGGSLPDGRNITFCPHCGQNLTVLNCPACGTELDVGWKFCTTCGRAAG
ncbi:MAG TPA: zinc ribbon domain-containing protein [Gemmatimonadaceae bacterium]|nr:zinc ribbon domain-containing protein [Gemmatimonadaceae bacterium]